MAAATIAGASPPAGERKIGFWEQREEAYASGVRGPFTAVHSAYLGYRGELNLYVVKDTLALEPTGRGFGLRINFAAPGFVVGPVKAKGFDGGTLTGRPILETWFVGKTVGDSLDLRVGRYLVSLGLQDEKTGRVLVYDPDRLQTFDGFEVFPPDDAFRVEASLEPADADTLEMGTSRGLHKTMVREARIRFTLDGREQVLSGFRSPEDEPGGPLFVPFRDATSGEETYGVGRYLQVVPREGDPTRAEVDFNRATNPWCAYSDHYNCILPPPENDLDVAVRAGERTPAGHGPDSGH